MKLIVLSGHPGAGKTTAALYIAKKKQFQILNVGDVLYRYLELKGINTPNRAEIGDLFLQTYGSDAIYQAILDNIGSEPTIIDGVRFHKTWNEIKKMHQQCYLLFVESTSDNRNERLRNRLINENFENTRRKYNQYYLEIELIRKSSIIINNDSTIENFFIKLDSFLAELNP